MSQDDLNDIIDTIESITMDNRVAKDIWTKHLARAIMDLDNPITHQNNSANWFISELVTVGSFLWVCEILSTKDIEFNANAIRRRYKDKIYKDYLY